jgi:hypothetical protein
MLCWQFLLRSEGMEQPQLTTYADITEVRTVTGAASCNQLLAEGWVLLGIYPLTRVADMTEGGSWWRAGEAETNPGHAAVCAAFGGLCCWKETGVIVYQKGSFVRHNCTEFKRHQTLFVI